MHLISHPYSKLVLRLRTEELIATGVSRRRARISAVLWLLRCSLTIPAEHSQEVAVRRVIQLICLLSLALTLSACGNATQAGQRTPSVIIQTAPPLPTATVPPTAQPTTAPTETAVPTALPQVQVTRSVNLRTGPGIAFSVIRTLRVKTVVELKSRRDENGDLWYEVRVGEDEGWVSGKILKVDAAQAAALPTNTDSFSSPTVTPKPTS